MSKASKILREMYDEILHVVNGCTGRWVTEELIDETRGKLKLIKDKYVKKDPEGAIKEMAFVPVQYTDPLYVRKGIQVILVDKENTVGKYFCEPGTETQWKCVAFNPETEAMTFRGVGDGAEGYTQILSAREFYEQYKWEDNNEI